jgi:hypothetical protein
MDMSSLLVEKVQAAWAMIDWAGAWITGIVADQRRIGSCIACQWSELRPARANRLRV